MDMVRKAARSLCDRVADTCNVNRDDNWATYSTDYIEDAEYALEACGANALLSALKMARSLMVTVDGYEENGPSISVIDAAIFKATGERA
jgi:hypothetical protein